MKKSVLVILIALVMAFGMIWVAGLKAESQSPPPPPPPAGGGPGGSPGAGPGKGGPPPESIEACKGKTEGDQCEFKGRNGETVPGTCAHRPEGGELHCRPKNPPPGGGPGSPGGPGKGGPAPNAEK